MSKMLDTVSFGNQEKISDNFMYTMATTGLKHDLSFQSRYGGRSSFFNDDTFPSIWDGFPSERNVMFDICLSSASNTNQYAKWSVSREFATTFVDRVYSLVCDRTDMESVLIKNKIVRCNLKKVDFLEEVCKYQLDPDDSDKFQIWIDTGMLLSSDQSFFRYLWDRVDRSPGSSQKKIDIINAANEKSALPMSIIEECAKSSTKNVKRTIVKHLASMAQNLKYDLIYSYGEDRVQKQAQLTSLNEVGMLFVVGNDDYEMIDNLIGILSKENLPWLLPAAAKNNWLSNKIQRAIDTKE
jgi:hypothetical protein